MSPRDPNPRDPADRQRLLEAIEVCRAGRDDPADPALAPLAEELARRPDLRQTHERLGRLDAALTGAFRDVPVPEGLRERLLARLAEVSSSTAEPPIVTRPETAGGRPAARRWRRRGLVAAVAASIALVGLICYHLAPATYSQDDVLRTAVESFQTPAAPGNLLASSANWLARYPLDPEVVTPPGARCREVEFLGCSGVAYDLPGWNGARATLYVIRRGSEIDIPELGNSPPATPQRTTGGLLAAAWQRNEFLYVLVVEGKGDRAYHDFLNPGRPLA